MVWFSCQFSVRLSKVVVRRFKCNSDAILIWLRNAIVNTLSFNANSVLLQFSICIHMLFSTKLPSIHFYANLFSSHFYAKLSMNHILWKQLSQNATLFYAVRIWNALLQTRTGPVFYPDQNRTAWMWTSFIGNNVISDDMWISAFLITSNLHQCEQGLYQQNMHKKRSMSYSLFSLKNSHSMSRTVCLLPACCSLCVMWIEKKEFPLGFGH